MYCNWDDKSCRESRIENSIYCSYHDNLIKKQKWKREFLTKYTISKYRDTIFFYKDDKLHRDDDKPAIITNNNKYYFTDNRLNRDNDKPAVIYSNGRLEYYKDGNLYKIFDDNKVTYLSNNLKHKLDGPAVVYSDSNENEFWIYGKRYFRENLYNEEIMRIKNKQNNFSDSY